MTTPDYNTAMLEARMGMGEYSYVYVLAYNVWLGHPMAEGPGSGLSRRAGEDSPRVIMGTEDQTISRIRGNILDMLRHQRESLSPESPEAWRVALGAEIAALEEDDSRVPWQDGVPEATAGSLEPYRDRFEGTYSPMTNAFELARNRKRGRWSYTSD